VLRRIFGSQRNERIGGCRKVHNEKLHKLYSSSDVRMIKSRGIIWTGNVASMGEKMSVYRTLVGKLGEK
jgi:hypothetical protein